jgi:hypothetical protein
MALLIAAINPCVALATDYFVATNGIDSNDRDGLSEGSAWGSLAYACDRVEAGKHAIHVLPGEYVATRTAFPKNGLSIIGRQPEGPDVSRIVASAEWTMPELAEFEGHEGFDQYLIAASAKRADGSWLPVEDLTVTNLELASLPSHRITGAFYCRDGTRIVLQYLNVHDFRWNGLRVEFSKSVEVHHCNVRDASTQRLPSREGGLVRTRWLADSRIHHNRIVAKETMGYGYKGGGHERVRLDHNFIDTTYFAIESPFEDERQLEIDHNHLTRCISIPRSMQGDPAKEGYEYSVRVHHNYLTDSYTIEGPRDYLELDHNWIHVEQRGGRIYSHHGGESRGPIKIHHNVIENLDTGFVWMNEGFVGNMSMFNNTIVCGDPGQHIGSILDAWSAERLDNWVFRNNIVVSAWSAPRWLHGMDRGIPTKITADHNLFVNCNEVPAGNFLNQSPGLLRTGAKPSSFYMPQAQTSFVVDRGVDMGSSFVGKAPDLGALEYGEAAWVLEDIPQP